MLRRPCAAVHSAILPLSRLQPAVHQGGLPLMHKLHVVPVMRSHAWLPPSSPSHRLRKLNSREQCLDCACVLRFMEVLKACIGQHCPAKCRVYHFVRVAKWRMVMPHCRSRTAKMWGHIGHRGGGLQMRHRNCLVRQRHRRRSGVQCRRWGRGTTTGGRSRELRMMSGQGSSWCRAGRMVLISSSPQGATLIPGGRCG